MEVWPKICGTGRSCQANNQVTLASSAPRYTTSKMSRRFARPRDSRSCTCIDTPATLQPSWQQRLPDPEHNVTRPGVIRPGLLGQINHAFVYANFHHAIPENTGVGCRPVATLLGNIKSNTTVHCIQIGLHGRKLCLTGLVAHGPGHRTAIPPPQTFCKLQAFLGPRQFQTIDCDLTLNHRPTALADQVFELRYRHNAIG